MSDTTGTYIGMEEAARLAKGEGKGRVEDAADVVIVGTGAAGATAARVLTEAGLEVVMIEEGPRIPPETIRADMYSAFRSTWRDMGFSVARGRAFTPVIQGCCVGGSTAINGAIIHRIPPPIHERWCHEFGLGDALPYTELERVWDQMDRELHVATAPDEARGQNNKLMEVGADAIGITSNIIRRNVIDCRATARCNQGCPSSARQSMDVSYVPRAIKDGARCYTNCRASSVAAKDGRAHGVVARFHAPLSRQTGPELYVHARQAVILAASAIQTPLLMKASGLGKESKLLGRRLRAHPGTGVVGLFKDKVKMWHGATQGHETVHYWDERMKFETIGLPPELGAVRIPGIGPELMQELADYGHLAMWGIQVRARAVGRVKKGLFGGVSIAYDLTNGDIRILKKGIVRITKMMFAAGAKQVLPGVHGLPDRIDSVDEIKKIHDVPDDPRLFHCIATHLFGTALMGADPKRSVLGLDRQAHELPGLYVADSSSFPTNMGVNPQHAIAAVAWLTAESIADRS